MTFKKHDFVEVEYTGRLDDNTVFDTTDATVAKQAGITRDAAKFGPVAICLGESHILKGIEEKIMEHGLGNFSVSLAPENAFGKKNAKLLKLIPMKVFVKEKIRPFTGLEVNIDNAYGIVRSVSGGRVIVDFNHPLSGRDVKYEVKVNKLIESPLEKAVAVFKNELNIHDIKLEYEAGKLVIEEKIPEQVMEALKKRIMDLAPEIKEVELKKPAEKKEEHHHHTE
jgi:FKBP-type peptidyl-prolyl cis-trans isomerase 2